MDTHFPVPTALVTGATGSVGPVLVRRLVANGFHVRALVRRAPPRGLLPANVELCVGDIRDEAAVRAGVAGATHVFHLAAKLHINNPHRALAREYREINVLGTRTVAVAAAAAGVERLVFFSTIAVYGPTSAGEVLDERAPARATSFYAATKHEAERVVLSCTRSDGLPLAVVLRLAGVYGSRVKGNYQELVRWLRRGAFVPVGAGGNRRTLVHEEDVARAALLAATHPAAAGGVFNVTDGAVHTFREILDVLCRALERRPPRLHVPVPLARAGARILDAGAGAAGRGAVATPVVEKLIEDVAVSGRRMQSELGFRPQFDLQSGWTDTIARLALR